MSLRYLTLAAILGCGLIGCNQSASTPPSAEAITPEALSAYKSSFSLADEPTQVVSILDARVHLSEPHHDDHAGHDHGDHAGHDHDEAAHHGEHDEHAHDEHADGHDHEGHDHAGHDHAGHDHAAHSGHEHAAPHETEHRDPVVLVGKIGGAPGAERSSAHFPFEKDKATFVMFDPSFESTEDEGHQHADGHECHFCQSKAQDAQAIVRFVGEDGKPLPVDARELFNVKENDLVVVKGHATVKAGMLIVDGEGIFIRQ